jgi:hypothetical protein
MNKKYFYVGATLLVLGLIVVACASPTPVAPTPLPTAAAVAKPTEVPKAALVIPNQAGWEKSGHNDAKAVAFTYWDTANPKEVPATCAKCHSNTGFQDFLGQDGSEAGKVDKAHATGQTITCDTCHNAKASALTSVTFPSGVTIKNVGDGIALANIPGQPVTSTQAFRLNALGNEVVCLQCHQGRASKVTIDTQIKNAAVTDVDTISDKITFVNIHYFAAGATLYGTVVKGGYEYDGKKYDGKFAHVDGYDTCVGCHNPHTLELKINECKTCHTNVNTKDDLKKIRMAGSLHDFNGNGDVKEGMAAELDGVRAKLYQAIQSYGKDVSKQAIAYDSATYPYFFADKNGNGKVDDDEKKSDNAFKGWTARLAKAAYNYQVSLKDPGAFAHGGKYIIQLMYDSIEDLNVKLPTKVDMAKMYRSDAGHFAGDTQPFRYWDTSEVGVPFRCAKCHSAEGLPEFIKTGGTVVVDRLGSTLIAGLNNKAPSNGFKCDTCHDDLTKYTRYKIANVTFPSGKVVDSKNPDTNLCLQCHQGRESTTSLNVQLAGKDADKVDAAISFKNIHYFAAGASLFGTEAQGGYEYAGKKYVGRNNHVAGFENCVNCHQTHELGVKLDKCQACHATVKTLADVDAIRMQNSKGDYDGNGKEEGIGVEVANLHKMLYASIQDYAKTVSGTPIVYNGDANPYWFVDANNDGKPDTDANGAAVRYNKWTPRLEQAAFDYQFVKKDPGASVHNGKYALQLLYDSIESLNTKVSKPVDMSKMVRPEVPAAK